MALTLNETTLTFGGAATISSGGNQITINSGAANLAITAAILALTGAQTVSSTLGVTGLTTLTGGAILAGTLDLDGRKLILDANGDTSITADTNDQIDVEVGGFDLGRITGGAGVNSELRLISPATNKYATLRLAMPASATAQAAIAFTEGAGSGAAGNMEYQIYYDANNAWLAVLSMDTDGSSTNAEVIRIPDGQLTVDGNSTFDDNAFDFVCEDCGWHSGEEPEDATCPECDGAVAWHDDVALMDSFLHCPQPKHRAVIEQMERLGVVNTYGSLDTPKPELFVSMNRMPFFLMSGLAQLSRRLKTIEHAVLA